MDAGLITILSVQGITLSVTVALFLGLLRTLRSDIRDVRGDLNHNFGPLPDWQGDGACHDNLQAHADLFPPYNGKAGIEEWERYLHKQMEGIIRWCSRCPVMEKCGEMAVEQELTGPYGGRTFFLGKEMGVPKPLISKAPGPVRRMYTANLTAHERESRRFFHDLLSSGEAAHPWQVGISTIPAA